MSFALTGECCCGLIICELCQCRAVPVRSTDATQLRDEILLSWVYWQSA